MPVLYTPSSNLFLIFFERFLDEWECFGILLELPVESYLSDSSSGQSEQLLIFFGSSMS